MTSTTKTEIPAILAFENALLDFKSKVCPLLDPAQEQEWDGMKLKQKEWAILQAGLVLAGHCIAILMHSLMLSQSIQGAAQERAKGKPGLTYTNQSFKKVPVTLIGGVVVYVLARYKLVRKSRKSKGRKRKKGKRGKSNGQGYYPELALLGIADSVSPLIRCLTAQAGTQATSFEQAKPWLEWAGISFSTRRIRRLSEAFCRRGLEVRQRRLEKYRKASPSNHSLAGYRVAIVVDGGRIYYRETQKRGRKRKSGWPSYKADWTEPKLLCIYVLDEQGRKVTGVNIPLLADGTLAGQDTFFEILQMYLRQLNIATAKQVVLLGDGAKWIWGNIPDLLKKLGCTESQIVEILDICHAVQHVYKLGVELFGKTPKAKQWAKPWEKEVRKGKTAKLLRAVAVILSGDNVHNREKSQTEYNYFANHNKRGHLAYDYFRSQKLPIGSGVIESLIRQVVNIRLKGCAKAWLKENAEAFLYARCQWVVQKWDDFCEDVLTFDLVPTFRTCFCTLKYLTPIFHEIGAISQKSS